MKKINFMILFFLVLQSCTPAFDGETITSIEARFIQNENSNPVSNIKLQILTNGVNDFGDSYSDYNNDVYNKFSDSNGTINFNLFKPLFEFDIEIDDPSNVYLPIYFSKVSLTNFTNYNLNLGTIKLFKENEIVNFILYTLQNSTNKTITNIEVIGNIYNPRQYLTPIENYFNNYYKVSKNQTLTIKYKLKNLENNTEESIEEQVQISDIDKEYLITY